MTLSYKLSALLADLVVKVVVAIGTGKSFRYVDATAIAHVLGVDKWKALLVFHALTGSVGRGKCTAWASWNAFSSVTPVLCTLVDTPSAAVLREVLPTIEREVRCCTIRPGQFFTQKGMEIKKIPPTDALVQHQAGIPSWPRLGPGPAESATPAQSSRLWRDSKGGCA